MRADTFQRVATFSDAITAQLANLRDALTAQLDEETTPPITATSRECAEFWAERDRQLGELRGLDAALLVVAQQMAEVRSRFVQVGGVRPGRPR